MRGAQKRRKMALKSYCFIWSLFSTNFRGALFWKHHESELYATTRIMHHNNEHPSSPKFTTPLESARNSIKSPIFSKSFATFVIATQRTLGLMEKGTRTNLIFMCPYTRQNQSWQILSQRLFSYTNQLFLYMKYVSSTSFFAFPCKLLPKSKQHKWSGETKFVEFLLQILMN